MPKASVQERSHAPSGERHVGLDGEAACVDYRPLAETESAPVK